MSMGRRMERIIAGSEVRRQEFGSGEREKMVAATVDDYRWLVSEAAGPSLAMASEVAKEAPRSRGPSRDVLTKITSQLRKRLTAERAHLVLEQLELRQRAREKFTLAEQMF